MRIVHIIFIILITGSPLFAQEQPPAKVVVSKITSQKVAENQSFIGFLYYDRISRVSSEVTGLVKAIKVREGDHVKKGDAIVQLNTERLDKEIAISKTIIKQTELRIKNAEKNYKRLEDLFKKEAASEKNFDDAFFSYQDLIKDKETAEKNQDKLLIEKRKSMIRAPFDGIILTKNIDKGDWVQQGKELVRIGSKKDFFVKVPIAEKMLRYTKVGEQVTVVINAFNNEMAGIVIGIDPSADPKTKNIFIKIKIAYPENAAENMSATVFVPTSDKKELKIIPRDALIKFQGKDFVYTVKEDKAAILPVNIVTYLGDKIGVDNPYFEEGMVVVVEGNERLQPDQPVVVAGEK